MLLIDIDGDNIFDNGIKPDLTLISKNDFPLEKNEPVFTGSIYIPFLNEALLNNTPVANGVFIDQPGITNYCGMNNSFLLPLTR